MEYFSCVRICANSFTYLCSQKPGQSAAGSGAEEGDEAKEEENEAKEEGFSQ